MVGVRSKIRHHGAPKAVGYTPASLAGGGVPMRLSASEVGDEGSDDDDADSARFYNAAGRTGSDRGSFASHRRTAASSRLPTGRFSQGSTPPSVQGSSPGDDDAPDAAETPVPGKFQRSGGAAASKTNDYFGHSSVAASAAAKSLSAGSGSSGERQFGDVGTMAAPSGGVAAAARFEGGKSADELRRRGSVDDRTMTMGAGRLFVANPD